MINKMTGENLDVIGALLGAERGAKADPEYRSFLVAQILIGDSSIYTANEVFILVSGADDVQYTWQGAGYYTMSGTDFNPIILESDIITVLGKLSGAGIRVDVVKAVDNYFGFADDPNANTFGNVYDPNDGGYLAELI